MTTKLETIFADFRPGSQGFVQAVATNCGFEISDDEIRRIATKAKTAEEFQTIWENLAWWTDDHNVPTYTVVDQQGTVLERHLTPQEAMGAILSDDSHNWEIRPAADGQGYILWADTFSRASGISKAMTETTIYSLDGDEPTATLEIAHKVIAARWPGNPQAILDADYDRDISEVTE
mgnify:CR=1 FL=1